jgi:hypothetical protein
MNILDILYINTYYKDKFDFDIEGVNYKTSKEGYVILIVTEDDYLPESSTLTTLTKIKEDEEGIHYELSPNSLFIRLHENTIREAYEGPIWNEIENLPSPYVRVKYFMKING